MTSVDVEFSATHAIGGRAEDLDVLWGVVWHFAVVLLVVGVSV